MKNRILITGIGLGQELDLCQVCNYDLGWLAKYPSNILWTDEILLAETFASHIKREPDSIAQKAVQHVFMQLEDHKIIKTFSVADHIDSILVDRIKDQVDEDVQRIIDQFQNSSIKDDHFATLEGTDFCLPNLYSIYVSVILASMMDAFCLHDSNTRHFLDTKLRLSQTNIIDMHEARVTHDIYNVFLPNLPLFPTISFCNPDQCRTCRKELDCKKNLEKEIERNVSRIIAARTKDEFYQFREFIDKYQKRNPLEDIGDIEGYKSDIKKEITKIQTVINRDIPRAKRITNLISFLSIPVSAGLGLMASPIAALIPQLASGMIQGSKLLLKNYESKHNWISFINHES